MSDMLDKNDGTPLSVTEGEGKLINNESNELKKDSEKITKNAACSCGCNCDKSDSADNKDSDSLFGTANGMKDNDTVEETPIIPSFMPPTASVSPMTNYTDPLSEMTPIERSMEIKDNVDDFYKTSHDSTLKENIVNKNEKPHEPTASAGSGYNNTSSGSGSTPRTATASKKSDDGGSMFLWVILIGVAALLIAIAFGSGTSITSATTDITGLQTVRVGDKITYKANLSDPSINLGEDTDIIWTINGKPVKTTKANDANAFSFDYTPDKTGSYTLGVSMGDYENLAQTRAISVKNPLLTIAMNDQKISYGDTEPGYSYKISGFRNGDTEESLKMKVAGAINGAHSNSGSYSIGLSSIPEVNGYDVEVKQGTLNVGRRNVTIDQSSITKVYDGTNKCPDCSKIKLNNVYNNENLTYTGNITYSDKNVGTKNIRFTNPALSGDTAVNYKLSGLEKATGTITPKEIKLTDLKAASKMYDGTTNVTFTGMGTLSGVISGDEVCVGEIVASFESASPGTAKKIKISEIKLVGKDAGNYKVCTDMDVTADIIGTSGTKTKGR